MQVDGKKLFYKTNCHDCIRGSGANFSATGQTAWIATRGLPDEEEIDLKPTTILQEMMREIVDNFLRIRSLEWQPRIKTKRSYSARVR